jgi:phosphatidate cytidylyltransferase
MTRLVTGLLLAVAACWLIFLSPPLVFRFAALFMGGACYYEFSNLAQQHGARLHWLLGLVAGALLLFLPYRPEIILSLFVLTTLAFALRLDSLNAVLPSSAAQAFGLLYAFVPWIFAERLRVRSVHWLFFALALNWVGDSFAYYAGRAFGRHRLAPIVSPNKSWEGSIASVIGSAVFGAVYLSYFGHEITVVRVVVIAIIANVVGQIGDLVESAMKRGAGVKDSGHILPGHGGILDRVDSSLFTLPVVYALLQLI